MIVKMKKKMKSEKEREKRREKIFCRFSLFFMRILLLVGHWVKQRYRECMIDETW